MPKPQTPEESLVEQQLKDRRDYRAALAERLSNSKSSTRQKEIETKILIVEAQIKELKELKEIVA